MTPFTMQTSFTFAPVTLREMHELLPKIDLRPSHVVLPKIGISRFFRDFTQKLGFQAKYMDFRCPRALEIPKKAP